MAEYARAEFGGGGGAQHGGGAEGAVAQRGGAGSLGGGAGRVGGGHPEVAQTPPAAALHLRGGSRECERGDSPLSTTAVCIAMFSLAACGWV